MSENRARPGGTCRRSGAGRAAVYFYAAAVLLAAQLSPRCASAVGPESPEVLKLVNSALAFLEKTEDERLEVLGGKCLVGLTFLKADRRSHPRVAAALKACRETTASNPPDEVLDIYSNGLAIIFLSELSPKDHAREIQWYTARMLKRQKEHGGWGYPNIATGDTSQTQYAALSLWEAHRRGIEINGNTLEKLADWLMRTQGPDGCWGYQGQLSTTGKPVEQHETNCSMLAAGLGCVYICADIFGVTIGDRRAAMEQAAAAPALPAALRPAAAEGEIAVKKIRPQRTNIAELFATMDRAHAWMSKNYAVDIGPKRYYYLYGLERYRSFQEQLEGRTESEPTWYRDGYEFLAKDQQPDGSWSGYCGAACDTAFATLFLLRSTQKSLRAKLGEGTLHSGRGLPTNLARAKVRNGQLIIEQVNTKVDELLSLLDEGDTEMLDDLARDPSQLVIETVDKQNARRLQQLVRGGEPQVRILAVRALGRTGDLDYVPTLLYALTDPDKRVVLEARDALQFISRKFEGVGPPDDFTDQQRYDALESWKRWYQSLRPAAVLDPRGIE